ncbi:MAG: RNB domain-containing ribonuclease [Chloroflexota bacterium]
MTRDWPHTGRVEHGRGGGGHRGGGQAAELERIATRVMLDRGFLSDSDPEALEQLADISAPAQGTDPSIRDLRHLLWCSIDNDDSRDLDQLTVSETLADGRVKILVAIADVDALVPLGSAIDRDAAHNTTSVYTAARIFPMLPLKLSTDLTSLNEHEDRLAVIFELVVDVRGTVESSAVFRAMVHNRAKLAYPSVAAWLENDGPLPSPAAAVPGMDDQLRVQDGVAQLLRARRHEHGALELETIEARAVIREDVVVDLHVEPMSRSRELIEDFMIAANGVSARFLASAGFPSLRRVIAEPERWERIVEVAFELGHSLPAEPDVRALARFLNDRRAADPERFPDLSLTIVKLLGNGEYAVLQPGKRPVGHFGLAVRDYSHTTAPNRRYPDLITQRLVKAALAGDRPPYDDDELVELARHCSDREDEAQRVERQIRKSAAVAVMESRIGEVFEALVTGASTKGTWVRVLQPPVEGKLVHGGSGVDVGQKIRVKLLATDMERGYIDFARA